MKVTGAKHIPQVLWILFKFIALLLVTMIGMIVGLFINHLVEDFEPLNKKSRPNKKYKILDSIFGNKYDGVEGDVYYKEKYNYNLNWWTRYQWSFIRNPVNNLKHAIGVNENIVCYKWIGRVDTEDRVGKEGFCYSEATGESGKVYPMYYVNFRYGSGRIGFTMNLGYKNFNVKPDKLPFNDNYSFTVAINPFKEFEV